MTDEQNEMAWRLLDLIFCGGDFYIDTFGPGDNGRSRLVVDGASYEVPPDLQEWIDGPFEAIMDERNPLDG